MLAVLAGLSAGLALYDRAGVWAFIVMVPVLYIAVMFSSYEQELPGLYSLHRVFVIPYCHFRMRELNLREVHDIPRNNELLAVSLNQI